MNNKFTIYLPGGSQVQAQTSWDSREGRHSVSGGQLTKTLGYIYPVRMDADGPIPPQDPWAPPSTKRMARELAYRATDHEGIELGGHVPTVEDATALVVGHAHRDDPAPEHVVPELKARE